MSGAVLNLSVPSPWLKPSFAVRDLVFIGVFGAVIKAASLIIAFFGGGMNPLTLIVKNFVYASLMLVLVHKVAKPWTMTLAVLVTSLVSLMLMGQGVLHTPGALAACLVAEAAVFALGGYGRTVNLVIGILALETATKAVSIGLAYLHYREQPGLLVMPLIIIGIGCIGTLLGLAGGVKFVKELRHASILS